MVPHNSEFTRKLRAAVRAKIEEFGIDVDDELPDYVMIMVGNKKDKVRMKTDLKLFLGDKTSDFVEWLFGFFQKVKSATSSTSVIAQQQQQKQDTIEMVSEKGKKQTTTGRTLDKGDEGGERATEKIPLTEENPTQHDRRGRMRESQSEKSTDRSKTINSLSVDSQTREEKIRPSRSKKRQLSPSSHRDAFPPTKSRSSSHNRSPQRNGRSRGVKQTPLDRTRPSLVLKTHGERSVSPTSRKSVVLPSKGPPALRSVVSVPVQFSPTVHPRVRAVARSPSPLPSSPSPFSPSPPRLLGSSPKVMLSGGIVPVMMKTATKRVKIVNQLDIAIATTQNEGLPQREETKANDAGEVMPRKQKVIRTAISPLPMNDQPNQTLDAATTKLARRRVIFGGGSLIFQRAIQQQQRTVATTVTSATSPQKTVPKAMVVVRPQIRMVTVASPDKAENKEDKEQAPAIEAIPTTTRPVQRRAMAVVAQQQTGVSLFQRAIKETKRQRTEGEDTEGIGKRPKRLSAEMLEPTDTEFVETEEEADAGEGKRPRIEREMHEKEKGEEEEKERVENEEKRNEKADKEKEVEEEDGEEKEEEVLTIDMSKGTGRKREIKRPPKFGLDLVKEHISGGQIAKDSRTKEEVTKKEHEQMEKGQQQISPLPLTDHRNEVPKNIQSPTDGQGGKENDNAERKVGKEMPETTVHFKRNWTSHASLLTTSAPIWDGRIEIDDMSSTDDEAEIDAVLADAQRLRKLALERELPPTAAMSRPLLYNPLDFSLSPESGLISPSDAALLPAVNYKQLMMLSSGSFFSEQKQQASSVNSSTSVVASSATDEAIISAVTVYVSSAASDGAQQLPQQRPHATVAPTTTIQAAPATMIVQQQYHYHHQNQQLRPRSHPYSQGYVVPTLTAHDYRYQVNRGSVSKVYTGGHKMQFALLQQQSVAMGNKDCLKQRLRLLREQHKQKTLSLQRHLEEQRLLLGQLQKMASTVELEQRKELLSRVRQMDVPIGKLKRELNEVCEQITKATKCDG